MRPSSITTRQAQGGPMIELEGRIRNVPDFPIPGIQFKDITTLLQKGEGLRSAIDQLHEQVSGLDVDIVVGMESRGFIFAAPLAYLLGAGLVPGRELGKLPAETLTGGCPLASGS